MVAVMTGIDPHKSSHAAVAIGRAEPPGGVRVGAWPSRRAAAGVGGGVAGAGLGGPGAPPGRGICRPRQLVAAGEQVLDVPPGLAARVRLLQAGDTSKNDPGDARPAAVAALRSAARRPVPAEDHAAVLKVWANRHRDLARARTRAACRLHAVLRPGPRRSPGEIPAARAARILGRVTPSGAVTRARCELAAGFLTGIGRLDARLRDTGKKPAAAARAPGTGLTGLSGAGPVIAGTVTGDVRQVFRFPGRDHFAACHGTAPAEVSSGGRTICRLPLRGNRRPSHAIHLAAISQIRHKHSQGRACHDKKPAEGKTHKEAPRALRRRISDAIYAAPAAEARQAAAAYPKGPGGQPGNRSVSRAAGLHPARRLFGQATPGPATTIRPRRYPRPRREPRGQGRASPPAPAPAPPGRVEKSPGPRQLTPTAKRHSLSAECFSNRNRAASPWTASPKSCSVLLRRAGAGPPWFRRPAAAPRLVAVT